MLTLLYSSYEVHICIVDGKMVLSKTMVTRANGLFCCSNVIGHRGDRFVYVFIGMRRLAGKLLLGRIH